MKKLSTIKILSIPVFLFFMFFAGSSLHASTECKTNETQDQCKARLNAEIAKKEAEIKKLEGEIKKEGSNQKTLSGEIARLRGEINKTASAIRKKNILIKNIKNEIYKKESTLKELNDKLRREKESLEKILRKRYELGQTTLFEFILSGKNISDFYQDIPTFSSVQESLSASFHRIDILKHTIFGEKLSLEDKKRQENDERYSLTLEKGKIEVQKKDRDVALKVSKSKKASLAALKKKREEEIRAIRAKLIQFRGNGMSKSISFGEAYDYAKRASEKTGVRTAFIMAIMQQETGFGHNVGGCYLKNDQNGDGVYIRSGNLAKRTMMISNIPNFKKITASLGRDWRKTPVSCAIYRNGKYYGYGGAMGYTQFLPNTWNMVEKRVRAYLGTSIANPWYAPDAVMATGIFLKDKGAASQTYTAEYNAACRYYGSCSSYAPSVMKKAANIQKTINTLERK